MTQPPTFTRTVEAYSTVPPGLAATWSSTTPAGSVARVSTAPVRTDSRRSVRPPPVYTEPAGPAATPPTPRSPLFIFSERTGHSVLGLIWLIRACPAAVAPYSHRKPPASAAIALRNDY